MVDFELGHKIRKMLYLFCDERGKKKNLSPRRKMEFITT